MNTISLDDLFPLQSYGEHRSHARQKGYCDPFVPYVGSKYGSGRLARFVYSGVAAGWQDHDCQEGDDFTVRAAGEASSKDFIDSGMNGSAYWRLFDAVLALLGREVTRSRMATALTLPTPP